MWDVQVFDNKTGKEKCSRCGLMATPLYDNYGEVSELICKDYLQKDQEEMKKASKSYKILLFLSPVIAIIIAILVFHIFLNKD